MISLITVSHNSGSDLLRYVSSFIESHLDKSLNAEFVFVENSRATGTESVIEPLRQAGYQVTFVTMDNLGFGAGCNVGANLSNGQVLVFANPDLEFKTRLDEIESIAGRWGTVTQLTGAGIARSFDLLPEYKSVLGELIGKYRRMTPPPSRYSSKLVPIGSFFCVDSDLFRAAGGFDERFFLYHEESELARRLQRIAGPPVFVSNVTVTHHSFGSQISSIATLGHEADGLITYARVTGIGGVIRTRVTLLLLMSPISATSRIRLMKLWSGWRRDRLRLGLTHD